MVVSDSSCYNSILAKSKMTTTHTLHLSLLRPSVLHILRATGFHAARPSVIDALVDITSRYLLLLASRTAAHASLAHNELAEPSLSDVRMALQDVGAMYPSTSELEEQLRPVEEGEDMRGIEAFLGWMTGPKNKEIRRIAEMENDNVEGATSAANGPVSGTAAATLAEATEEKKEDFLKMLKKKHSKTGEESRYQGTAIGIAAEARATKIEGGGNLDSVQVWEDILKGVSSKASDGRVSTSASSPLTEIENV